MSDAEILLQMTLRYFDHQYHYYILNRCYGSGVTLAEAQRNAVKTWRMENYE